MGTLRETIAGLTKQHLLEGGLLYGQCLSAVGFVAGTIPSDLANHPNLKELPTSDVSNGGVVVGAALAGKRPIYVIRYQGFGWYNFASIVNYAAKSKYLWGISCPLFVRGLGMEGGIGPVAGGMNHSIIAHMPDIKVFAPMSPDEYDWVWDNFQNNDDPVYCSEHRKSFDRSEPFLNIWRKDPAITIVAVGGSRVNAEIVAKDRNDCDLFNIVTIKGSSDDLEYNGVDNEELRLSVKKTRNVLILDSDMTMCGVAEHLAFCIQQKSMNKVNIALMGLKDKTAGFSPDTDNLTSGIGNIIEKVKLMKRQVQFSEISKCMGG